MGYWSPYGWVNGNSFGTPNYGTWFSSQQPSPPSQNDDNIGHVHGREGAITLGHSLGPNKSRLVVDETKENVIWCIVTDSAGFPTVKSLRYEEMPDENGNDTTETPVYVTTKEFDELKNTVDGLIKELGGGK